MKGCDGPFEKVVAESRPEWAIVLGSGLAAVAERAEVLAECPFSDVPELPEPKVTGHSAKFFAARIGGVPALLVQGRVHLYEGYSAAEVSATVRFLAECGIRRLVLTNAAGSLNRAHPPGSWMMITDHLNLTGTSPLIGGGNFVDMSEVYSASLRGRFAKCAIEAGVTLHQGVYAGVLGPQYETPAEIRMLQQLGADAVGMSTVIEAIQARALGIEVAGFSCLTNWAAGLADAPLRHEEVLEAGRVAGEELTTILERALRQAC